MKIKDFNEKVRIGTLVVFRGHTAKVVDIQRAKHVLKIPGSRWIRCCDIELPKVEEADGKRMPPHSRPVIVYSPDGSEREFPSQSEAADYAGCCASLVSLYCGKPNQRTRKGYRFEFSEDIKHEYEYEFEED